MVVDLYPHQQKAVDKLDNGKILWGGVGTGKSRTALAYYYTKVCGGELDKMGSMTKPRDVYIITTAKKRDSLDWHQEAARFGIGREKEGSVQGVTITVDSWNNIGNYTKVRDAFFIFDEQRLVGSGTWTKAFIHIAKSNGWILLSATPGDTWLDYIPVFVANGFYKNRTEFKRTHVVYNTFSKFPKVDRYIEVGRLVKYRNKLLVHMPYERHTVRHSKDILVDYDENLFEKVVEKRWHVYEERPLRDVAELFSVMRKVVNSNSSRLRAIRGLMTSHPKLIVFYNFDYELEALRTLSEVPQISSSTPPTNHSEKSLESGTMPSESASTSIGMDSLKGTLQNSTEFSTLVPDSSEPATAFTKTSDPLKGTSWEKGWDEEEAMMRNALLLEKSSSLSSDQSPLINGSGSRSSVSGTPLMPQACPLGSSRSFEKTFPPSSDSKGVSFKKSTPLTPEKSAGSRSVPSAPNDGFAVAEWNGHKHEPIPKTDRWVYLVQYQAGAEGWNCIETNAMVFYSQTYSYKIFHQAHGRIDRLNTPFTDLYYYNLMSKSLIDKAIKKSLGGKRSFNESSLKI